MSVYMEQRSYPCHICVHGTTVVQLNNVVSLSCLCTWNNDYIPVKSVHGKKVVSLSCLCTWNNGYIPVKSVHGKKGRISIMSVYVEQRLYPCQVCAWKKVVSLSCLCTWNNGYIPVKSVHGKRLYLYHVCVRGTTIISLSSLSMEKRLYLYHVCVRGTTVISLSSLCIEKGRISIMSVYVEQR